jgi:hypothetical protein
MDTKLVAAKILFCKGDVLSWWKSVNFTAKNGLRSLKTRIIFVAMAGRLG